jgi:hypothetical protein
MRAPDRTLIVLVALVVGFGLAAQAEPPGDDTTGYLSESDVYRREVFRYQVGGRPDPFQPLISGDDIGVRAQDLVLEGIVYSSTPGASIAIFTLPAGGGRARLRVGQRIGSVTVMAIHPRRVDLREDQFGVGRIHTIELQRRGADAREGDGSAPPQAQPPTVEAAPAAPPAAGGRP